ncbi:spermatogenesis-associated protein 33 isoform X2 [Macaca fascicularis]|uniref:spermatogenesis-associated protein 33 isoform X2 n=1 Tax=Macaca fascicularis TaxID=9541 RepID=UPI0032B04505
MGLSKSKQKPRKGEEQKKESIYSVPKSKDKLMEKHSQETRQADRESEKPVDSLHPGSAAAKHPSPAASQEDVTCSSSPSAVIVRPPQSCGTRNLM